IMNGFAVINKGLGMSSSDVVIKCRNALSHAINEKIKCGHMGTLDPMAEGVLIIAFGNATRLFDFLLSKEKSYDATFTFGEARDTVDSAGKIIATSKLPQYQQILDLLPNFIGEISQVPPKYSAVNVNGQRAYDMARAGKDFQLDAKKVTIKDITVLDKTLIGDACQDLRVSITCGSGTYIRSLCSDIAKEAEVCGYMSKLTRVNCGGYSLQDSVTLSDFVKNPLDYVRNIKGLLQQVMPVIQLDEKTYIKLRNGRCIDCELEDGTYGVEYNSNVCFIISVKRKKAKSVCYLQD
ncbi:MAG: tRNA pseudouridine(55) synthase TruB, partial [Clostridia bacterium]|nr:tRNA pseudouridine(55) synthase TruB [Clostridia bacterium]